MSLGNRCIASVLFPFDDILRVSSIARPLNSSRLAGFSSNDEKKLYRHSVRQCGETRDLVKRGTTLFLSFHLNVAETFQNRRGGSTGKDLWRTFLPSITTFERIYRTPLWVKSQVTHSNSQKPAFTGLRKWFRRVCLATMRFSHPPIYSTPLGSSITTEGVRTAPAIAMLHRGTNPDILGSVPLRRIPDPWTAS
jgi:hypothetical protein